MPATFITLAGYRIPGLLYGTAWKEERTRALTRLALEKGFRGIDTANQRKHYDESAVGAAVASAIANGWITREALFLQTKFTFSGGQDHRLPYDPGAAIATQVEQSFASSLRHLGVTNLDSLILHGPSQHRGLGAADWEAWRALEAIHARGGTRFLGISNVNLDQLDELCQKAHVPPHFVQNRCYAALGWDRTVRGFCNARGIRYQGFSLLTANRQVLAHPHARLIAERHERSVSQVIFCFALQIGMMVLTGTTSDQHMEQDLALESMQLNEVEMREMEQIGG